MKVSKYYKDLFITAWEGGSSYWAEVDDHRNVETIFDDIVNIRKITHVN